MTRLCGSSYLKCQMHRNHLGCWSQRVKNLRHILIHGVESWSGVEPWSGVVFLELFLWSQCKSFKVRDD